jgi:hypothetical protein
MNETSLSEIEKRAMKLHKDGEEWHFHIMSPSCHFNIESQYAFVLEDISNNKSFIYYSDKAEKEVGHRLALLLHGKQVLEQNKDTEYTSTKEIQQMLDEMKDLNDKNTEWHHHIFFPGCRYNQNSPKFTLVFEGESLVESISEIEPTDALNKIEKLFYKK